MFPSSSTVAWATLFYPSSRKWSLVFHLCRRLRVSPVSLGNILVSRSQSVWIIGQNLLLNLSHWCLGSLSDRVYFRILVFCHFHWWLFSMYLVIFNEKSSWVILYFPEILCWNPNSVQYFYSCVAQWQCQGIFFCTIYFIYVPTWDHSSIFLCSYSLLREREKGEKP